MREWNPVHLDGVLSEDMIGEAWLLGRIRAGIVEKCGGGMHRAHARGDAPRGPPLWELDERSQWRPREDGPCRVRVGLAQTGG